MAAGPTAITMMPLGDTSHDKPATFLVHAYGRIELIVGDRIALFDAPACQQLQRVLEGIDSYMGVDGVYLGWATGEPGKTRTFSILIDGDSYHEFYRPTDAARAAAQLLTARTAARPVQPTAGVDEVQRDGQSVIDRARFAANAKGYALRKATRSVAAVREAHGWGPYDLVAPNGWEPLAGLCIEELEPKIAALRPFNVPRPAPARAAPTPTPPAPLTPTIPALEARIAELERQLRDRDARILDLERDLKAAQDMVAFYRQQQSDDDQPR